VQEGGAVDVVLDTNTARATYTSLTLNGPIRFSGAGTVTFPPLPADVVVTAGGSVGVSGGANLVGSSGAATVRISASQANAAEANVPSGHTFTAAGNLLGTDGTLTVSGTFVVQSLNVEPTITVAGSGIVVIQGTSVDAGNLELEAGATVRIQTRNGLATRFNVIESCPEGAHMEVHVNGLFSTNTVAGGTAFTYTAGTNAPTLICDVTLVDDSGETLPLTRPSAGATRRLLSCDQAEANWGATSMTYNTHCGNQFSGAASTGPAILLASLTVVVAFCLRR